MDDKERQERLQEREGIKQVRRKNTRMVGRQECKREGQRKEIRRNGVMTEELKERTQGRTSQGQKDKGHMKGRKEENIMVKPREKHMKDKQKKK